MIFQQILNKDSGLSTRAKLNSMLSALIQSDEGVNAVWVFLKSLEQAMQTLSSKEDNDVADLRDSLSGANDYTDKAVNKLYTYVDAMNGGVGGLIDSTSYDPSGLPTDKPCTLIALGSGTFTNLKDSNNTAITVSQSNSITVFFRAAHITYWNYKTEVLTAPPMDATPTNGNTTHVVSSDGVYDFVMAHGIDNVDVADVTGSDYLKDRIMYSMRKNMGTVSEPDYEIIAEFTIPIATATKAGLMPAYVDGVFDVNRYVGSNTPYDSLSQVLNNAATLIPTAVRRGGMSIKFIQSSDNKYVQYRLMSPTWSTTVTNWQGVDSSLIAGSQNLTKSGDIYLSSNYIIDSLDDANFGEPIFQASNTRLLYVFKTIERDIVINADNLPQGYQIAARFALTRSNVIANTSIVVNIGWQTKLVDVHIPYNKDFYGAIAFRKTDNSALNNDDIATVKASINISILSTDARIDKLKDNLLSNYFIGRRDEFVEQKIYGLLPNRHYRISFPVRDWSMTDVTSTGVYRFDFGYYLNGNKSSINGVGIDSTVAAYYDFETPAEFDYLYVGGRAASGEKVYFVIEDREDVVSLDSRVTNNTTSISAINLLERNKERLRIFIFPRPIYLEINSPNILFNFTDIYIRAIGSSEERYLTMSQLAEELNTSLVTSTAGVENCIAVPNSTVLVYDFNGNVFKIVGRESVQSTQCVLISNSSASVDYIYSGFLNSWDNEKKINVINENLNKINVISFTGKGNTHSYIDIKNIIPQNRYRVYLQNTEWDTSAVTVTGVFKFYTIAINNGAQTILAGVEMKGTVKSYYDFIAPETFDEIRIGGRANTGVDVPFELINLTTLEEKCDLVPYFSSMEHPVFSEIDLSVPTLKVKFLSTGLFRLYTAWGRSLIGDYSGAGNQTFTLTNLKSLVWDFNDSSVKVVDTSATGNYVHLLNLTRDSVTGLLVGWFNEHMRKETLSGIDGKINTLGEEISVSKNYNITTGTAAFSASVNVGIPYNRKIIFRINDPDGTITKMVDLAGYDYDGNNVVFITGVYLLPNTNYEVYTPCGIKSIRCWIGSSFMTGTAGTITVQVTAPSQFAGDNIIKMWSSDDKLLIRNNLTANADFKALFFSDIHGNTARFERILQLGNGWKDIIDCIIDGGDDTANYKSQGNLDWYNTRALTSEKPIVRAAGNHDAWTTNYGVWATNQELYEYFTAVAVAQLTAKGATIVQPSDAATAYKNYYYVDFGSLRIIVITSFNAGGYYDTDQAAWFASVLDDARTNNKSVICLNHAPMPLISAVENVECNWCSYKTRVSDGTIMEQDPLDKVDAFIRAGGKFVCWFTGHTHIDFVMKYSKTVGDVTKTQFAFTTSTARGGTNDGAQPLSDKRNPAYDLFNMVSVDLTNHLLKIWRIGFNTNAYLQVHNTFVWDFVNDKLVSES